MSPAKRCTRRFLPAEQSRPAGFTLLELLIVTGLLTLLAAVSWPSVRRSMSRASHSRAVDEVIELLADARSQSIADGYPRLVELGPMGRRLEVYLVVFDEAGASAFLADTLQGGATAATPTPPSRVAAPGEPNASLLADDLVDPNDPSDGNRRPLPSGVDWQRASTLELPEGIWFRVEHNAAGRATAADGRLSLDGGPVARAESLLPNDAAGLPSGPTPAYRDEPRQGLGVASDLPMRLLFGVEGRTADLQLQICNVSGLCTTVSLDGALGIIRKGETRRQKVAVRDPVQQPYAAEGNAP